MVDLDGDDAQPAAVVDHPFLFVGAEDDPHVFGVDFMVGDPDIAVGLGRLPRALGDVVDPRGAVDVQRPG